MFAQASVSGQVVDAGRIEMPDVNIAIKGTMVGTMTGADGTFTLSSIPGGKDAVLVFSFIGFRSQEVKVGNRTFINVKLEEDTEQLEEVVVIGYGTARKKDLSGAISNVRMTDELAALPNPNVMGSLSSKVAGFRYSPTNSAGGDNFSSLNIRGKNAIPADVSAGQQSVNQPLLIVDGVISFGSINEINTNDIQSVDVLKDASAAAIYGSRAANGVIIITTKRGLSERPVINVNSSWNFSGWSRMPKMVTDEEKFFRNRFYAKQAGGSIPSDAVWSSDFDRAQLMNTVEYDAYNEGVYTDWLDEISRTGFGQKYDVSVSGRSKIVNYYISGDYTRQKGIRKGDDYEKYNIMTKLDIQAKEWLKIGLKGNYLGAKEWGVPARIQNATWMTPYSYTHARQPGYENWPNSRPDGNSASPFWGSGAGDSHLWTDDQKRNYNINGVAYAQVDFPFLQGLSYRISLNARRNSAMRDVFNDPRIWVNTDNTADMDNPDKFGVNVEGYSYTQLSSTWNVDNIFTYTRDFKKHHVDAMIGYTREASNSELLRTDFKGFSVPTTLGVYKQDLANTRTIRRERTSSSAIGILTRVNYNYKSTYYANFTFRRDGYSAFSAGNKWGNFYGASAAWVLSNENFVKDNADWLDYLKLRFSWGQNGSRSVSPYATIGSVGTTYTWFGDSASGSAFGLVPSSLPNRSLTWATVEKFNVGIDYNVLAGRLGGAVDVYAGKTTDMLMNRSVPYPTGFQTAKANAGKVTNKGIEITLNSVNIDGDGKEKFRWETNVVFDLNRNEIKSLYGKNYKGEEADDVANAVAYGFDSYYALIIGKPIGAAYDLKKVGVFQSQEEVDNYVDKDGNKIMPNAVPGDLKFEDFNDGSRSVDDHGDVEKIGNSTPRFEYGLRLGASYKGFDASIFMQGVGSRKIWGAGFLAIPGFNTGDGAMPQAFAGDYWTEENTNAFYPAACNMGGSNSGYNLQKQDRYLLNMAYFRIKNITLGYTLPRELTSKIWINKARVYVACEKFFTFDKLNGLPIDPEEISGFSMFNSDNYNSSRTGVGTPTMKNMSVGIQLNF